MRLTLDSMSDLVSSIGDWPPEWAAEAQELAATLGVDVWTAWEMVVTGHGFNPCLGTPLEPAPDYGRDGHFQL